MNVDDDDDDDHDRDFYGCRLNLGGDDEPRLFGYEFGPCKFHTGDVTVTLLLISTGSTKIIAVTRAH